MSIQGTRHLAFVVFPDALLLDLSGPLGAFELSCETGGPDGPPYRLSVTSPSGGLVRTSGGLQILTRSLAEVEDDVDTLTVVGGPGVHEAARDERLVEWLAHRAPGIRRVCSVCTGAFLLGAAGLLRGRRAVTHWGSCSLLEQRHPDTTVSPDAIYMRDGPVWTSAGVTAGIDLLALIEEDRGHREAIRVARRLVMFLKRPGGQAQYSVPLSLQAAEDAGFDALHDWIGSHLGDDLRVEVLADRAGMSPRTFARLYAARTGRTPAKVVEDLRVEAARRALEDSGQALKVIAKRCGFLDEERMRRAFQRRLGIAPQDYRRRFSSA